MADITLSQSIRQRLLSMQGTADAAARARLRPAAAQAADARPDWAQDLVVPYGLTAQAADLARLLDGIGQSVQSLEAAGRGIDSLSHLVGTALEAARQARQSPSTTARLQSEQAYTPATPLVGTAAGQFQAGDAFTLTVGTMARSFVLSAAGGALDTTAKVVDAINADPVLNPPGQPPAVWAYFDADGRLVIEAPGGQDLTLGLSDGGSANTAPNSLADLMGAGVAANEGNVAARRARPNDSRAAFASTYDRIRDEIDRLAREAGQGGANLFNGDALTVAFNDSDTASLNVPGVTFDAQGLGLAADAGQNGFQSDGDLDAAIDSLGAALATLRAQAATFGSSLAAVETRHDLTRNLIATLQAGTGRLSLSDTSEEGANLLALQTRQQLSGTAMSLSAQADQAVLRLFD